MKDSDAFNTTPVIIMSTSSSAVRRTVVTVILLVIGVANSSSCFSGLDVGTRANERNVVSNGRTQPIFSAGARAETLNTLSGRQTSSPFFFERTTDDERDVSISLFHASMHDEPLVRPEIKVDGRSSSTVFASIGRRPTEISVTYNCVGLGTTMMWLRVTCSDDEENPIFIFWTKYCSASANDRPSPSSYPDEDGRGHGGNVERNRVENVGTSRLVHNDVVANGMVRYAWSTSSESHIVPFSKRESTFYVDGVMSSPPRIEVSDPSGLIVMQREVDKSNVVVLEYICSGEAGSGRHIVTMWIEDNMPICWMKVCDESEWASFWLFDMIFLFAVACVVGFLVLSCYRYHVKKMRDPRELCPVYYYIVAQLFERGGPGEGMFGHMTRSYDFDDDFRGVEEDDEIELDMGGGSYQHGTGL